MTGLALPLAGAVLLCDGVLGLLLLLSVHQWDVTRVVCSWDALLAVHTDALDLVASFVLRVGLLSSLAWLAVKVGSLPGEAEANGYQPVDTEETAAADPLARDQQDKQRRWAATLRRNGCLVALFVGMTAMSVLTALKSVTFQYSQEALEGPMMIALVACINTEFYLVKAAVEGLTLEPGHLLLSLHPHPLHFESVARRRCILCATRVQRQAYYCRQCVAFICPGCFRRGNRSTGEGLLRTDKGIHEEQPVTNGQYFLRALLLTRPFAHIVLVAFACLLVNQGTRLLLPKTQGAILDSVIQMDHDAFSTHVQLYVVLSVSTGFFGAIRSFCVDVAGRKMTNEVNNKLFAALVVQDIAFFDGTNTGQLTSRLANDASQMVNPMRTLLNTLLSNVLLLLGGLVMCFVTSWRLSMVAFTSMGPIVYATQVYAKWSRNINREIWDEMAKGNTVATEAFANIRTVRAFSTEAGEVQKYRSAMAEALARGLKDAAAGAGTYAFTNYVDLGAGVLVLWYGGRIVMTKDGLTAGNLITFQLYWNMLNDAWKGLNDIINAFTRAAGAAQRVLSLMDLKPDIDPDGGECLPGVKGEVRLEDVDFHYQMRPDARVLAGVSLTIRPNTMWALVGRSGGGKSTIVHLLMRFYDPKRGRILLDGHDLCNLNVKWLHDQMGLVAQDTRTGPAERSITPPASFLLFNLWHGHCSSMQTGDSQLDAFLRDSKTHCKTTAVLCARMF
eukprot:EG_transcript_2227